MDFFRRAGGIPAYLIRQRLIIADLEPGLEAIFCTVYDEVDSTEVVGCLYDIIDIDTFI